MLGDSLLAHQPGLRFWRAAAYAGRTNVVLFGVAELSIAAREGEGQRASARACSRNNAAR
jgi:hypothetical protein